MTIQVIFEEMAEASLMKLVGNDPRYNAIKRSIADRVGFMTGKYGRPCPAVPGRNLWVDRPMIPPLRILVELGTPHRIWSITRADDDGEDG